VADGLYNEQLTINKNINLIGESRQYTIIDGTANGLPVLVHNADVILTNFTIQNGSGDNGGGIYNNGGTLSLENCSLINNNAIRGGAVFNNLGTVKILNSYIKDNYASEYGGGIYNEDILVLINCDIVQNTASTKYGGGIYSTQGLMILTNCVLENNRAIYGGAIYSHQDEDVKIIKSKFKENNSTNNCGGGLLNYYSNITIEKCVFQANHAHDNGGGILNYFGNININNTVFIENFAGINGGGFNNAHGNAIITSSYFEENEAGNNGGGISNRGSMILSGSNISSNTANAGGGLYNFEGDLVAHFNRFYINYPDEIQLEDGYVDTRYNWWGSNKPEFRNLITGPMNYSPWLVMKFTVNPTTLIQGGIATLMADFRYDSNGVFHNPLNGHLPDDTLVTFTTTLGKLGSSSVNKSTSAGIATATLVATQYGEGLLTAQTDAQVSTENITIYQRSVMPVLNGIRVPMQKTGTPIIPLLIAFVLISISFLELKKK
jgi:predicted outer membrane repeat protein